MNVNIKNTIYDNNLYEEKSYSENNDHHLFKITDQ
jgi:hypothetical protein